MRGDEDEQAEVWSYIPLEQRVPADHPLRPLHGVRDHAYRNVAPVLAEHQPVQLARFRGVWHQVP